MNYSHQYLEEEKIRIFVERAEKISKKTRTRKMVGATLLAIGAFLLIVSWVLTGLTMMYVLLGAIGAALFGFGGYYLLTEPSIKVWLTLIDEVDNALKTTDAENELRKKLEDAITRHKDEPVLAGRIRDILERNQGEKLREKLSELIKEYRRIG